MRGFGASHLLARLRGIYEIQLHNSTSPRTHTKGGRDPPPRQRKTPISLTRVAGLILICILALLGGPRARVQSYTATLVRSTGAIFQPQSMNDHAEVAGTCYSNEGLACARNHFPNEPEMLAAWNLERAPSRRAAKPAAFAEPLPQAPTGAAEPGLGEKTAFPRQFDENCARGMHGKSQHSGTRSRRAERGRAPSQRARGRWPRL